jgi:hypothetical protein
MVIIYRGNIYHFFLKFLTEIKKKISFEEINQIITTHKKENMEKKEKENENSQKTKQETLNRYSYIGNIC